MTQKKRELNIPELNLKRESKFRIDFNIVLWQYYNFYAIYIVCIYRPKNVFSFLRSSSKILLVNQFLLGLDQPD